jgi:ankyrin repeat protein
LKIKRIGLIFDPAVLILPVILFASCVNLNVANTDRYSRNHQSDTSLMDAVEEGDNERVRTLIAAGANLNVRNEETGAPPLTLAVVKGRIDTASLLLDSGAQVDAADRFGRTPLIMAASVGDFEGAKLLLAYGANVNWEANGWTPLFASLTRNGTPEITKLFLEHGASKGLQQAFLLAIDRERIDSMRLLLNAGAKVNGNFPPLLAAVRTGNTESVNVLLEAGADVNGKDDDGTTPLILAALFNHEGIIKMLLEAGADLNGISRSKEILDIVDSAGADQDKISKTGITALMLAEMNGSQEVVKMLRDRGAH